MTDLTTTDILSMQEDEIAALKTKYKELKDTYKDFVLVAKERLEAWKNLALVYEKVFFLTETMKQQGHIGDKIDRLKSLNEL